MSTRTESLAPSPAVSQEPVPSAGRTAAREAARARNRAAVELLPAVLAGERSARTRFVRLIEPAVRLRVCCRLRAAASGGRDFRQEVDDLAQDVYLDLFRRDAKALRSWSPDAGLDLLGWISLLAERQVATVLRSRRKCPWSDDPTDTPKLHDALVAAEDPERTIAAREMLDQVRTCIERGSTSRGRALFVPLLVEEQRIGDVMERFGLSAASLYCWRRRFRDQLRPLEVDALAA